MRDTQTPKQNNQVGGGGLELGERLSGRSELVERLWDVATGGCTTQGWPE